MSDIQQSKRGTLFVVSAPAGTGKNTLVDQLLGDFPSMRESVSCTTRPPRAGEDAGQHYHFLSLSEFRSREAAGEFLETAKVFGNFYGTPRSSVEALLESGSHVVLVIDTVGQKTVAKLMDCVSIFISPPSLEELERRLRMRKTDDDHIISRRLASAEREMACIPNYDYHIVNDDRDTAYEVLKSIVIAATHAVSKRRFE